MKTYTFMVKRTITLPQAPEWCSKSLAEQIWTAGMLWAAVMDSITRPRCEESIRDEESAWGLQDEMIKTIGSLGRIEYNELWGGTELYRALRGALPLEAA